MQENPNWINSIENPFTSLETNLHFLFSTDGMGEKPGKFFLLFFQIFHVIVIVFFLFLSCLFVTLQGQEKVDENESGKPEIIWTFFFLLPFSGRIHYPKCRIGY